jgi:hypothetical protein
MDMSNNAADVAYNRDTHPETVKAFGFAVLHNGMSLNASKFNKGFITVNATLACGPAACLPWCA